MKYSIIAVSCLLLAITCLVACFNTNDLPNAQLYKALALVFLLVTMKNFKQVETTDSNQNNSHA